MKNKLASFKEDNPASLGTSGESCVAALGRLLHSGSSAARRA